MFEWDWDSVATECSQALEPAGFAYVQVSPPQEHITGPEWFTDYQPVSYDIISKRGNREEFAKMITTCHTAGLKVIADAVFNHMAGIDSGNGTGGSSFTHFQYGNLYQDENFHHCTLEPDGQIHSFTNREEVQTCMLTNLAEPIVFGSLATDTEYVQSRLAAYANDLFSLGVDGLRLDAAKNIAATDIANITTQFTKQPYITQEVIWGPGEPIQPSEYVNIGDVQEFRYTTALREAFLGQSSSLSNLQDLDSLGWVPGNQANVFVTNHDTERSGDSLNYSSPSNTYANSMIFSLAHPYGHPTILSSFKYDNASDGSPNNGELRLPHMFMHESLTLWLWIERCARSGSGFCNDQSDWLCQHRLPAVVAMVGFRNTVGSSASLVDWISPQPQQIAFGRGQAGFVAINNVDSTWTAKFTTSLPDGTYCDVLRGDNSTGTCTGPNYAVTTGKFSVAIPARSSLAIHVGSTSSIAPSQVYTSTSGSATKRVASHLSVLMWAFFHCQTARACPINLSPM
ncbi:hypothetical protein EW146_g5900 [Bondarzewia mesenterica]|uniref:Alpha-amylase n=1 Tax=Bondarzewia mesenterica TaxID=1095465 RepID=A0A4S4LVU0_9AGAM|nr:hypothetical protein EW146_g5900 [Bondarzewia mesenterica]